MYAAIFFMVFLMLSGCSHYGPTTIEQDRFDYNTAISNSWKEQTLLNIVKLRYADMPLFVEVASVVSGYTLESSVNVGGKTTSAGGGIGDTLTLGTARKYTDRPTITYSPITGSKFNKNFMTPISPKAVLFLMLSGWPADLIFPITVDSINGFRSDIAAGVNRRAGDDSYYKAIELMRKIQKSGTVSMGIIKGESNYETTVIFLQKENTKPEITEAQHELRKLLGLKADSHEIQVNYGLLPKSDQEIAILTRSTLHIMIKLATQIDVPDQHVAKGLTVPSLTLSESAKGNIGRLIQIHSGNERPDYAFVAVRYEDKWFWIDKRDYKSKRTFAFLMILFSLSETGGKDRLPLVTIPAG